MSQTQKPNRFVSIFRAGALAAASLLLIAPAARAVDGGLGRSISGAQIIPYQAIVPPEEGEFFVSLSVNYYPASIGGQKTLPLGNKLVANIDADITLVPLTFAYDWPGVAEKWNVLSAITVPWAKVSLDADVSTSGGLASHRSDSDSGLYDIMIRVAQASYHINQTQHFSIAFDLWAPAGSYDSKRLANLSLDNWTYVTTFSYTHILPEPGIELSGLWALEYYTPNRSTDYHSGMMSRVEALAIKRLPSGLGAGLVGSWMQQLTSDSGPVADLFNGFEGRAFGIGAIVTWSGTAGKVPLNASARWVHEFENRNLLEGDVFSISIGTQF